MTEAGLKQAYKNKPEALEEMLKFKTIEELCTLFEDENFVEKGSGKTDRFYDAVMNIESENNSSETNSQEIKIINENTGKPKSWVAVYPIRCNGELIEANSEVKAEELGGDLERLIKIGAILEILDNSN